MKPKTKEKVLKIFEKVLRTYKPDRYEINEIGNGCREANELHLRMFAIKKAWPEEKGRKILKEIESKYHPGFSSFGETSGNDDWADDETSVGIGWNLNS